MDFPIKCLKCKCGFQGKAGLSEVQLCNMCAIEVGMQAIEQFRVDDELNWIIGPALNMSIDLAQKAINNFKETNRKMFSETRQKYHELNKTQVKKEEKYPVHYVANILDDNTLCGEYTWKIGMCCTLNILDVTCGCCKGKYHAIVDAPKPSPGDGSFTEEMKKDDYLFPKKQESWRDRPSQL